MSFPKIYGRSLCVLLGVLLPLLAIDALLLLSAGITYLLAR